MKPTLRALLIEDVSDDAELVVLELSQAGFDLEWKRVETAADMTAALAESSWDVILSDFSVPNFGAVQALQVLKESRLDIPFLLVSGTIGEEMAVALVRSGVSDYILKDNLKRLGSVVLRELREAYNRRAKACVDHEVLQLAAIVRSSNDAIISESLDGIITSWNPAAERLLGWSAAEALGRSISFIAPADLVESQKQLLGQVRTGERMSPFETARLHKDLSRIEVSVDLHPIQAQDGSLIGISKVLRNITEKKKAAREQARQAAALGQSEERYRLLVESIPHVMWLADADGGCNYLNQRGLDSLGVGFEAVRGWCWVGLLHPEDLDRSRKSWQAAIAAGRAHRDEYRIRQVDGAFRWYLAQAEPIRRPGGAVDRWVCTWTDIDDRVRAEETTARHALLLASVRDAVLVTDLDGLVTYWNEGATRLFGWSAAEMVGQPFSGRREDVFREEIDARMDRIASGIDHNGEWQDVHKDGSPLWIDARVSRLFDSTGKPVGVIGVGQDIGDRKRIETERDLILRRLQMQVERLPLAYMLMDADFRITDWNPAAERIFGYSRQEMVGQRPPFHDLVNADFKEGGAILARLKSGDMAAHSINQNRTKDGRTIVCQWYNTPLMDAAGTFVGALALAEDITASQAATQALQMRDRAIQAVLQGILITDPNLPDNPIVYASPGCALLTGYSAAEVLGHNCRMMQGKDTDPEARSRIRLAVERGEPCTEELLNYRKDGSTFWNELSISPVRDEHGKLTHFVGVQTDVTARRLLEQQYRQSQKMEAVGQLAGGVAHDFNNLLTIINGYSELLLEEAAPDDPAREPLMMIQRAGDRSASLTRQLLTFSRHQVVVPKVLDLNDILHNLEKMLRRIIGEDVVFATVLDKNLAAVRADAGQIEQVIMNLVINARDAMPQGGKLTIETRNVELTADQVFALPRSKPGAYVVLSVTDSGTGMTQAVRERIFEPFYTTKGIGKGTGLGLAVVHGIVAQIGGCIEVLSEPGQGSSFRVYLGQVDRIAPGNGARRALENAPRGTERVLLVEDDELVRELSRRILASCGYTVLEASDGTSALKLAADDAESIQLMVTDVVMPGIGGRDLAERLNALHPETRVLYVSGYNNDAVVRYGVLHDRMSFLQKPFSSSSLAHKVREVLDAR